MVYSTFPNLDIEFFCTAFFAALFFCLPKTVTEHFHLMPWMVMCDMGVQNGEDNSMIDFVSIHQVSGERKGGRKEGEND